MESEKGEEALGAVEKACCTGPALQQCWIKAGVEVIDMMGKGRMLQSLRVV